MNLAVAAANASVSPIGLEKALQGWRWGHTELGAAQNGLEYLGAVGTGPSVIAWATLSANLVCFFFCRRFDLTHLVTFRVQIDSLPAGGKYALLR